MRIQPLFPTGASCAAALLLLLSGCEDQDARVKSDAARKETAELRSDVAKLREELAALKTKNDVLQDSLSKQITTRMDEMNKSVNQIQNDLLSKVDESSKSTQDQFKAQMEGARSNFDNMLKQRMEVDVAQSLTAIRDEVKKVREDLLGFMDKKLRELYPYAYQPKRMDDTKPPEAPQP